MMYLSWDSLAAEWRLRKSEAFLSAFGHALETMAVKSSQLLQTKTAWIVLLAGCTSYRKHKQKAGSVEHLANECVQALQVVSCKWQSNQEAHWLLLPQDQLCAHQPCPCGQQDWGHTQRERFIVPQRRPAESHYIAATPSC